ncbi:MAG TPA: ATP-binding cassette domain-containing protein [Candidatus Dormibacteraeota bacterium]
MIVDCEGLVHIYKTAELEVVALQGLDLQLQEGETIAIAGRSGSGKTTLMNILAGAEPPTAGRARVAGHDLARMPEPARERYRRLVVGYVWQHSHVNLWPELTALENVQVPMLSGGVPGREHPGRARRLLEAMGIGAQARRRPARLLGGENQRLALAVALANRPALLLADEPTAELDSSTARSLLADLANLLQETKTSAIMVTHDRQLERFVDRVIQIRDGRTSLETRWRETDAGLAADELVILDRAGRLQLPRALVEKLGLGERVRVHVEDDHLRIYRA